MASLIGGIVSITLGAIMMATVFMPQIHDVNQSYDCVNSSGGAAVCSWTSSETSLWSVVGLVGVVGIILGTLAVFGVI